MIRVLHFADIHIGMENYGHLDPKSGVNTRVLDFLARLDEMIGFAREHDVDLAVFAGDAFKNRTPNPTLQREFAHRILDLAALCPVVLLVGNHDLPANAIRASSVEIYDTLAVPNVHVAQTFDLQSIQTKRGPVQIATAPYPIRASVLNADETQGMTIGQLDEQLRGALITLLRDLALRAAQSNVPRLLTGHFTVSGAAFGSERNVMVGRDIEVPYGEIADPAWDYVAMGHIHKHQNLTQGRAGLPPVVYSGSMERIDFGESADSKGFCWVELERGHAAWQFVQVHSRPFISLHCDVRGLTRPLDAVIETIEAHHLEDSIVRMLIHTDGETEMQLDDRTITEHLNRRKPSYVAAIHKEVDRATRTRLGANPESLTDAELLERYFSSKQFSPEQIQTLLDYAQPIFESNLHV